MKLDLGCGDKPSGDVNADVRAIAGVDVRADIRSLPFRDGAVDHILMSHVLEHFYEWEQRQVLSEVGRVLTDDGILEVVVPNVRSYCNLVHIFHQEPCLVGYTHGLGTADMLPWSEHHYSFTPRDLSNRLSSAGFTVFRYVPSGDTHEWKYTSTYQKLLDKHPLWSREIHCFAKKGRNSPIQISDDVEALRDLLEFIE